MYSRGGCPMSVYKNNETIVIAGLRRKELTQAETKVPLLGDIPALGLLFRSRSTQETDRELAVFLTPSIYTTGELSEKEKTQTEMIETMRKRTFMEKAGPLK